MSQHALFPDLAKDRQAAIEADINAAGGQQQVGVALELHDDAIEAGKILSNKINRNGRHRVSDEDAWKIKQLARERKGYSRLHELESQMLHFDGRWLTTDDIKAMRKKRKAALLAELVQLEAEDQS